MNKQLGKKFENHPRKDEIHTPKNVYYTFAYIPTGREVAGYMQRKCQQEICTRQLSMSLSLDDYLVLIAQFLFPLLHVLLPVKKVPLQM